MDIKIEVWRNCCPQGTNMTRTFKKTTFFWLVPQGEGHKPSKIASKWLLKSSPNTLREQHYAWTWLGYSKRPLFSARSSQGEGHRHSKIAFKWSQNQPRLHTAAHVPTNTKVLSDLELQKQVLKGKLARLSNNSHMLLSILLHLQFSKDVLSVLPVFDDRYHCILASRSVHFNNFFTYFSDLCPRYYRTAQKRL